jgi:hypothetical protein
MPHTQVAISVKTQMHKNPRHRWTPNDLSDVDAVSVAYAYCDAVFPDKAMRHALATSKELGVLGTFVPRRAAEMKDWIDARPPIVGPACLVPHPLAKRVESGGLSTPTP